MLKYNYRGREGPALKSFAESKIEILNNLERRTK